MKLIITFIFWIIVCSVFIQADNIKINNLLEQIQQTKNMKEKEELINQLKVQLSQINKKAREESNAILDAKQKRPSKLFNLKESKK